jgi:hypothetical protein
MVSYFIVPPWFNPSAYRCRERYIIRPSRLGKGVDDEGEQVLARLQRRPTGTVEDQMNEVAPGCVQPALTVG